MGSSARARVLGSAAVNLEQRAGQLLLDARRLPPGPEQEAAEAEANRLYRQIANIRAEQRRLEKQARNTPGTDWLYDPLWKQNGWLPGVDVAAITEASTPWPDVGCPSDCLCARCTKRRDGECDVPPRLCRPCRAMFPRRPPENTTFCREFRPGRGHPRNAK